jgi:hypothetical protein
MVTDFDADIAPSARHQTFFHELKSGFANNFFGFLNIHGFILIEILRN